MRHPSDTAALLFWRHVSPVPYRTEPTYLNYKASARYKIQYLNYAAARRGASVELINLLFNCESLTF